MEANFRDDDFPFCSQQEFDKAIAAICVPVSEFLTRFTTRILKVDGNYKAAHGTGSFICVGQTICILTAAHVSDDPALQGFVIDGRDHGLNRHPFTIPYPLDISIAPIAAQANWNVPGVRTIPSEMFRPFSSHAREIFAFCGASREGHKQLFGADIQRMTISLASIEDLPPDSRFTSAHIGVGYTPEKVINLESVSHLPRPDGFSGSTLWNTRLVECRIKGEAWSPDKMQVAGVIWGWPDKHACLAATRVELVIAACHSLGEALDVFELRMDAIFQVMQGRPANFQELSDKWDALAIRRNRLAMEQLKKRLVGSGITLPSAEP